MKCLVLAAGYATRLYPLTENFPKPLLRVRGKTILDWLIDDVDSCGLVDEYIIISNAKFYDNFVGWAKSKSQSITIVNDGTFNNENRLGAVKDIEFAIKSLTINEDMLVIAGDNLLDFSLTKFVKYALTKNHTCVMRYFEQDDKRLSKSGVLKIDETADLVLSMAEKPANPESNWCCPPFYYYTKEDAAKISIAIEDGCSIDAPGSFISWLCTRSNVYAMKMPGKRYDIGSLDSYNLVNEEYKGIR